MDRMVLKLMFVNYMNESTSKDRLNSHFNEKMIQSVMFN